MKEFNNKEYTDAVQDFSDTHAFLKTGFTIEGRTIEQWSKHFNIKIDSSLDNDISGTRNLLGKIGNLIQECSDIYSQMKFSRMYIEMAYNAKIQEGKAEFIANKITKTNNRADTLIRGKNLGKKMTLDIGELIEVFFEEQLKKLKSVASKLDTIANSQMSELKTIHYRGYNTNE